MYCPKCGGLLTVRQDSWGYHVYYCEPGGMWASARMTSTLDSLFGEGSDPASQSPLPQFHAQFHRGLRWFCPACGVPIGERLECPRCGRHLRALVRPLVELHPHER